MFVGWSKVTRRSGSAVLLGPGSDWAPVRVERNARGIVCRSIAQHLGHHDFFVYWLDDPPKRRNAPWHEKKKAAVITVAPTVHATPVAAPVQGILNFGA